MTQEHSHFIVPTRYYVVTFILLIILTVITVAASRIDFGAFNMTVALGIAGVKAALVLCVFMGLWWDRGFTWVLLVGSLVCLGIFVAFTFTDTAFRGTIDPLEEGVHGLNSPVQVNTKNQAH